ncbi:uncharacterized protein AC631_00906 [Debaryomyces fabryi]|uniref:Vacuolar membrane protein n=1 Tax=Debaryomyces fabryi TaxID=58627 RepID=A0A0V1Q421_9ASCO|nr:uncharacterized protein AC631_00906 [Debaryomyces fabryi]KSA03268.1 hypothetical protein AC631_00906 [Debaryomyces fabryi]CUM45093.1 unnamed protein product [Debaryomyces fabryi]
MGQNDSNYVQGHFDPHKEIDKYDLDDSTFDLINIDKFHNTKASTVFSFMFIWILMMLSWVLLAVDIYTCLNILVFHRWSNDDYKPYAYSVAKWIFTGCIIFQFLLLIYHWIWAIHTFRTKNIALTYVNWIARLLYIIRSYNYHCLFHQIEQDNFFDWACFLSYDELDHALQILVADTPRQVINILTLRYYATDGDILNDIIRNIKKIATSNLRLSIILSFMCLSFAIWSIFFFKFLLGMILYIPVMVKLRKRNYKSLKKYCCDVVNENVRVLVLKNHKSKKTLLEEGIVDIKDINTNPLLSSSTTTFDFDYKPEDMSRTAGHQNSRNIPVPSAIHEVNSGYRYNDNYKLFNKGATHTYESLPLDDLSSQYHVVRPSVPQSYIPSNLQRAYNTNDSNYSFTNPFDDNNKMTSRDNLIFTRSANAPSRKKPPTEKDPFDDDAAISLNDSFDKSQPLAQRRSSNSSLTDTSYHPSRTTGKQQSQSSLGYYSPAKSELEPYSITHSNSTHIPYPLRGVSMYGPDSEHEESSDRDNDKFEKVSSSSETGYQVESRSSTDDDTNFAYNTHH